MCALILALLLFPLVSLAAEPPPVEHFDPLEFVNSLSIHETVEATFREYPQGAIIAALRDEAGALQRRSNSVVAGYPMIYLQWIDDRTFNDRGEIQVQTGYQIPFWLWGQRDASRAVAKDAEQSTAAFGQALKLEVAGLVREALWNLELTQNRLELAEQVHEVSTQLFQTVRRRVELGDLARSDQLLAESDMLDKQSQLTMAEAERMHARKAYTVLTRMNRAPSHFQETLSKTTSITESHPAVKASNAYVERAQAEVEFTRLSKQGNQPSVLIGTQHDRGRRGDPMNNESNIILQIPIGGDSWNAPYVAQSNLALTQKLSDRATLLRQLERALHEAEHNLEVDRATLEIANQRKAIAETHLQMSRLAFAAGEIQLIDYFKILANSQAAIRDAREKAILVQRDIAFFNQVVGELP
jgi:outer membrane protein TolC